MYVLLASSHAEEPVLFVYSFLQNENKRAPVEAGADAKRIGRLTEKKVLRTRKCLLNQLGSEIKLWENVVAQELVSLLPAVILATFICWGKPLFDVTVFEHEFWFQCDVRARRLRTPVYISRQFVIFGMRVGTGLGRISRL